jgi:hypothetical protein
MYHQQQPATLVDLAVHSRLYQPVLQGLHSCTPENVRKKEISHFKHNSVSAYSNLKYLQLITHIEMSLELYLNHFID